MYNFPGEHRTPGSGPELLRFADLPFEFYNGLNYSVYVIDYNWNYLFINTFARTFLGERGKDLIGKNVWDQFRDNGFEQIEAILRPRINERKTFELNINSPLSGNTINIRGFALSDAFYFSVQTILPANGSPAAIAQAKWEPVKVSSCLLVEDDEDDLDLFKSAAKEVAPHTNLVTAIDGLDAIQVLKSLATAPELIFLDLNMPRMNGFDFLDFIRTRPSFERIPVVVYTTSASAADHQRAIALGAVEVLTKRNRYQELCELLQRFLK